MTINIENFFNPHDIRQYIRQPFQLDGLTIATNGTTLLAMPAHGDYQACDDNLAERTRGFISLAKNREFKPLPIDIALPEQTTCGVCAGTGKATKQTCKECDGDGEVELSSDYSDYICDCKTCNGDGSVIAKGGDADCHKCAGTGRAYQLGDLAEVDGVTVNPELLRYIISEPDLEISADIEKHMLHFRAGEAWGIIMGMVA